VWKWSSVWAIVLPTSAHSLSLSIGHKFLFSSALARLCPKVTYKVKFQLQQLCGTHMWGLDSLTHSVVNAINLLSCLCQVETRPSPWTSCRIYPQVWPHLSSRQSARKFACEVSSQILSPSLVWKSGPHLLWFFLAWLSINPRYFSSISKAHN